MQHLHSARCIGKKIHKALSFIRCSSTFDIDSSVNFLRTDSSRDVTICSGKVGEKWSIGNVPNGGLMMCLAINGARKVVSHPDPLTFTAYYLKPTIEDCPIELHIRALSQTKKTSTVHVQLIQEDIVRSEYIGILGTVGDKNGLNHSTMSSPGLLKNPPSTCFKASNYLFDQYPQDLKINQMVDIRIPYSEPFVQNLLSSDGSASAPHHSSINCWIRFQQETHTPSSPPSVLPYALFQDIFPPTPLFIRPCSWVATLQYTVHFWNHPPTSTAAANNSEQPLHGWVQAKVCSEHVVDGRVVTDSELWSSDGTTLLATSRQLAKILSVRKSE